MIIRTELLGLLRKITDTHEVRIDLPEDSQVNDLINRLEEKLPPLVEFRDRIQVTANFDFVSRHHRISETETISLFIAEDDGARS